MRLKIIFDGWDGYNTSIIRAVEGLTSDQLAFRAVDAMRSVGELATHIAFGRIDWFPRMNAPGSVDLAREAASISQADVAGDAVEIVRWLENTWSMIDEILSTWTVEDLSVTYEHEYWGNVYAVSRQWTLWRIMAHDIHHGGQLSELLSMQGIAAPELVDLGGHITEPPVVRKA